MTKKRLGRSSHCEPEVVLTDGQIAALSDKFGDQYRDLPQQDLQDLAAFLPVGSKGRDVFLFRLLVAANHYWATLRSKSELRELDRVIGALHSDMRRLTKLDRSRIYALENRMGHLTILDRALGELIFQYTVLRDPQFGREYIASFVLTCSDFGKTAAASCDFREIKPQISRRVH